MHTFRGKGISDDVPVQCIGEAFGVGPSDKAQVDRLSIKPASLTSLFDLFLKTRDRMSAGAAASSQPAPSSAAASPSTPSQKDVAEAEALKAKGNSFMGSKKYDEAIDAYGKAIALNPRNAVYYSNRAAAYSSAGDHGKAIDDAKQAIDVDAKFSKAYHRLGCVYSLRPYITACFQPKYVHTGMLTIR